MLTCPNCESEDIEFIDSEHVDDCDCMCSYYRCNECSVEFDECEPDGEKDN